MKVYNVLLSKFEKNRDGNTKQRSLYIQKGYTSFAVTNSKGENEETAAVTEHLNSQ